MNPEPGGSNETYDLSYSEGYGAAFKPSNSYPSPSPKSQVPRTGEFSPLSGPGAASEQPIS